MVTIGLSLTIPCALFASLFVPSAAAEAITYTSLAGAALVCVGFGLLSMQGFDESKGVDERSPEPAAEPSRDH